jgi:catechol 1,2-dioxygenase
VQTAIGGEQKVLYDITMSEKLDVEPASLNKLTGFYVHQDDKNITCDFFVSKNRLWYNMVWGRKLDPFGRVLEYIDKNTFHSPWLPERMMNLFVFEIISNGTVKCTNTYINDKEKKYIDVFIKEK